MENLITGIAMSSEGQPIAFSSENKSFQFCFTNTNILSGGQRNKKIEFTNQNGFIYGKTHDNHIIAISIGDARLNLYNVCYLNTSAYIISVSNRFEQEFSEFDRICFRGGTLNKVFFMNAMELEYEEEKITANYKDDSIAYTIQTKEYHMELVIHSGVQEGWGINGSYIKNDMVELELKFDKPQPLEAMFIHYAKMKDLLSFMTFRKNVGFDEVCLLKEASNLPGPVKCADVYIKEENIDSSKNLYTNITFEDIREQIPNLIKIFYDTEKRKPSYSLGFYPENDKDVSWMNPQKIRAICSALECELSFAQDIKAEENKLLTALIEKTRNCVKDFRKENSGLSNDTYNGIFSDIRNWTLPLAEKICALYDKYRYEMLQLYQTSFEIKEDNIRDFVKYRNDITHGSHRVLEGEIVETAYYLMGLVYCCVLSRIGVSREKILELCRHKILR